MSDKNAAVDEALALGLYNSGGTFLCTQCARPIVGLGYAEAGSDAMFCSYTCLQADERLRHGGITVRNGTDPVGDRYVAGRDERLPDFVVLHLGCGRKQHLEQLPLISCFNAAGDEVVPPIRVINLDGMAHVGAHLTATLGRDRIAVPDDSVDLVLATHVLEHIGRQGELEGWFQFWGEAYRVLKPSGRLQFLSPYYTSQWCWADPTHSRAISEFVFVYLNQDSYRVPPEQTAIPDYRPPCDFQMARWDLVADTDLRTRQKEGRSHISGVLVARKPFRPYWEEIR